MNNIYTLDENLNKQIEYDTDNTYGISLRDFQSYLNHTISYYSSFSRFNMDCIITDVYFDDVRMNLTSFITILENIQDQLPELSIYEYNRLIHYFKMYDLRELDDEDGQFSYYITNGINRNNSIFNTLFNAFYYGLESYPFSLFYDGKRTPLPSLITECMYGFMDDAKSNFDIFEILARVNKVKQTATITRVVPNNEKESEIPNIYGTISNQISYSQKPVAFG